MRTPSLPAQTTSEDGPVCREFMGAFKRECGKPAAYRITYLILRQYTLSGEPEYVTALKCPRHAHRYEKRLDTQVDRLEGM